MNREKLNVTLDEIIKKAESDKELKSYFGRDKPLSSGILDDIGVLMEQLGNDYVVARLKDKAENDEKIKAFKKLYEYLEDINNLNVPRYVKGYILKKLEAIATIKIRRE